MQRPVYRHLVNAKDKPTLIFVADFHQAQVVCDSLISYSRKKGGQRFARPMVSLSGVSDPDLKDYLAKGVGFIYMGMNTEDKLLVERLFDSGQLLILVVTVAMCWAIQSRSNLTIIMDTQQHNGIEASEYKLTDMMQMIGLTGRPMADHECSCIVMCHYSKANHYERFLREPLSSESELPSNLIAHINYEVATGEITELNNIYKPYLAHTFFYKRISVNPNYYGIILPEDSEQKSKVFGSFFNNLVNKVALDLDKAEFISMEGSHENPNFTAGLLSRISLEYYINYETLSNYTKWLATTGKQDIRPLELIELISTSTFEFRRMPVRHGELPNLKSLQRRHRPREGDQIHDVGFKIKLLILSQYQKTDGKADELEGELIADRWFVITQTHRLLMAVVDIAWLKDSFSLAKTAIQLSKKIVPFSRSTLPNIDMETSIAKEGDEIVIGITVKRENEPFSQEEFNRSFASLPTSMYRDEGWCFLIHGQPRVKKSEEPDKFLLFKRVKTPAVGINEYKLNFVPTENASSYTYDLYLMSDFYSTKEDRKVANIDVIGLSLSS